MNGRFLLSCVGILLAMHIGATPQEPSREHPHAYAHFVQSRDNSAGGSVSGVAPSVLLYAPDPTYTRAARQAHVNGTVVLRGKVGVDGCLREVKVIRSLGYGLEESAAYAVQRWKFKPFQENGKPTVKDIHIEVNFDPVWSPDHADLPKQRCGDNPEGDHNE
jgi:TonB family protein